MTPWSSDNPSHKFTRKNYLIDRRFQLKYAGLIVFATALVSAGLFAFLWKTSRAAVRESQTALDQSRNAAEASKRALGETQKAHEIIGKSYLDNPQHRDDPKALTRVMEAARLQDQYIKAQRAAIEKHNDALAPQQAAVVREQSTMLRGIILGLVGLVVLIGLLGIYFTHKVAGPVYKMKQLLKQVGDGKLAIATRLRKGDELQDFFEAFESMVATLRQRQEQEIAEFEKLIETAPTSGIGELVTRLTAMRDQLKRELEA